MRSLIYLMGFAISLFAGPLHAGSLLLTYEGVLADGSSDELANDLSGLSFTLSAVFDSTPVAVLPGAGQYALSQLTATVGGVDYVETDPTWFDFNFYDPTAFDPSDAGYVPHLVGGSGFAPIFTSATPLVTGPGVDATVFSGYIGSYDNQVDILTNLGFVRLIYNDVIGVTASIAAYQDPSAVPEPSTAVLVALGGLGCLWAARRKTRVSAV